MLSNGTNNYSQTTHEKHIVGRMPRGAYSCWRREMNKGVPKPVPSCGNLCFIAIRKMCNCQSHKNIMENNSTKKQQQKNLLFLHVIINKLMSWNTLINLFSERIRLLPSSTEVVKGLSSKVTVFPMVTCSVDSALQYTRLWKIRYKNTT